MSRKDITDKMVCEAYAESKRQREVGLTKTYWFPYEILSLWTGEPQKVCYRATQRANDRRLIDYGVSLRTGWLTNKGIELLNRQD